MNPERSGGEVEVDLMRHPEKKGTPVSTQEKVIIEDEEGRKKEESKEGAPGPLPQEGIIQAQEEARKFAERLRDIPRAVVFGYVSNQPRTAEADFILGMELQHVAKELPNSRVFDRNQDGTLEQIAARVDEKADRVIIINSQTEPAMGMHNWNLKPVIKRLETMGESEYLAQWMGNPELQKEAGLTPEEMAEEMKQWVAEQTRQARELFPGRPVIITGFGHSWDLDVGIAALMGKKFTRETLGEMGGEQIKTMEGAKIVVQPDGTGTIEYRDIKEELDLSPTKEE